MPAQDRLGFDDEERFTPALQSAREQDEQRTVCTRQARSLDRALEDNELRAT